MINHVRLLLCLLSITIAGAGCGSEINSRLGLGPASSEAADSMPTALESVPQFTPDLLSADHGLAQFDSYRANFILDFEGLRAEQRSAGHIESLLEINRSMKAVHQYLNVDATLPDRQIQAGISQFFSVDNEIFVSRAEEILRFETTAESPVTAGDMGFLELDKFIILPATVSSPPTLERLDGHLVQRYSFDQSDLRTPNISFQQAEGDLWIDRTGEAYLAQYIISATVKILSPIPNGDILDEGTLHLSYKVADINSTVSINLPEQLEVKSGPFAQLPSPPESELIAVYPTLIEYTSVISPLSATLFYQTGLPTRGWTEEKAELFNDKARLTFSKENEHLTIIITPSDSPDVIKIVLNMFSQ